MKKAKSSRAASGKVDAKNKWFVINDDSFQEPLDSTVAAQLEAAYVDKQWFTEVAVGDDKYVKLFTEGLYWKLDDTHLTHPIDQTMCACLNATTKKICSDA